MRPTTSFVVAAAGLVIAACTDPPPGRTYYERNIEPILIQSCAGNTSGCHRTAADDPHQFAAGNFDVTSFAAVQKRRDLLAPFGAYPVPLLLIKAVGARQIQFQYGGEFKDVLVDHVGGNILALGSDAYLTLLSWTANGATINGLPPPTPARVGEGACSPSLPSGFDPAPYVAHPDFAEFRDQVMPVLETCNSGNCHGAPASDLFIACGDDQAQLAFNFSQAWAFVDDPAAHSQLLQVPLAVAAGGVRHTGGDQFASATAPGYQALLAWATKVGRIDFAAGDPGKLFFKDHVQPTLLARGCGFAACHSPMATNDFKLRSGTDGFFSPVETDRNYHLLRDEFMALEVPDPRHARAAVKNLLPEDGGVGHRGGPLFGAAGPCPQPFDPAAREPRPFCVLEEWARIERAAMVGRGEVAAMASGDTVPLVFIQRPATQLVSPLEFDTYQPGADLRVADANLGAKGAVTGVGPSRSLLGGCGVNLAQVDVRGPDVRHDGTTIAFAMRTGAGDPLGIWLVDVDGTGCRRVTPAEPDRNGLKVHDFDPAWSPDGTWLVYASTRGTAANGPTRSRKLFLPQSDLWRIKPDGTGDEQLTFLTNSEVTPSTMRDGRIIMTTEKVSDGFYQLSGRRLNWDDTDYHPLLAQRAVSPYADPADLTATKPSVGYGQATEIREDLDGNFLVVFSDPGAKGGAGTLATFNRSVGAFEAGRMDDAYLRSVRILDPAATGRPGAMTDGAYRSPAPMPDGRILASYAAVRGDLGTVASLDWDLVAVDPVTGTRAPLIAEPGAQLEGVFAIKAPPRKPYINRRQLVFGGAIDPAVTGVGRAIVTMPDAPMVFTMLTGNLRRGRPVDAFRRATRLAVYVEAFPPAGTMTGNTASGIYQNRVRVGSAPLRADGSVRINVPGGLGAVIALEDAAGNTVVTMTEEHQLALGEQISLGIREGLFDAVCGGCHGSVSGNELDVAVSPDALTGASQSLSRTADPVQFPNDD